jgi:hypothetical protein
MINLNMIAERRARKTREIATLRGTAIGDILLFLAAVVINLTTFYVCGTIKEEQQSWQHNLANLQPQEKAYQDLSREVQALRPVVTVLEKVRMTEAAWMTILADLGRVMPRGASIGGVTASSGTAGVTLTMNGNATEPRVVGEFMVDLREKTLWAGETKLSSLTSESKDNAQVVHFGLTVAVRSMFGGEL